MLNLNKNYRTVKVQKYSPLKTREVQKYSPSGVRSNPQSGSKVFPTPGCKQFF